MVTIQTIYRYPEAIREAKAIIVDEAHRMSSSSIQYGTLIKIAEENDTPIIGLTATPFRLGSGCLIHGKDPIFKKCSYEISIGHLVQNGWLTRVTNRFPNLDAKAHLDKTKLKLVKGEYSDASQIAQLNDKMIEAQAKLIAKVFRSTERKCGIVFAVSINHAVALNNYLRLEGLRSGVAHSKQTKQETEDAIQGFRDDKYELIVNRDMLTTGFDKIELDFGVLARATKSAGLYIQMVGRLMRVAPNKTISMVLDLAGVVDEHGPIDCPEIESQMADDNSLPPIILPRIELTEEEKEAGLSDETIEEQIEEQIKIKVHQSRDIMLGEDKWANAYIASSEEIGTPVLRVNRVTFKPKISHAGNIMMVLNVYGKNIRTGGNQSARMYFNFWHDSDFVASKSRAKFRDLLAVNALPDFFYQKGNPVTPNGQMLIADSLYEEAMEKRANLLLKFKLVRVNKEDTGYLTITREREVPELSLVISN
jgi:hypothetical protein